MVDKIREGFNIRSGSLPMDEEAEAVIVTPYVLNPTTQIWEPMQPYAATALGTVRVQDGVDANRLLAVDANGRVGVVISTSPLAVIATDLDIRDLNTTQDLVLATVATNPLPVAVSTSPLPISATDLDIRNLSSTQDSVAATITTSPLPVSATDFDIRDLVIADRVNASQDRPTRDPNKTYKAAMLRSGTGSRTLYTVTTGKTLYVQSMTISVFNTSVTAAGELVVRDNTTDRLAVVIPTASSAALPAMVGAFNPVYPEPRRYTADINVLVASGTLTYAISMTGYEE